MKLLSARVENFRMIKSLSLEFSIKEERNLTVIRAANESGKTTLLLALQWALYGDEALPTESSRFRLSPIDAAKNGKGSITCLVEVKFRAPTKVGHSDYKIVRFAEESVDGKSWKRLRTGVTLYEIRPSGAEKIEHPSSQINAHLPRELREVFFTDGDKALTFIEGDKTAQSKRVEDAIRSLLSLEVLENSIKHVQQVRSELNRQIRKDHTHDQRLREVAEKLERNESEKQTLAMKIKESRDKNYRLQNLADKADRDLEEILKKGDRSDLERKKVSAKLRLKSAWEAVANTTRKSADLFKSELLGKELFASELAKAKSLLDVLRDQGKIPSQTIPVLEDRLKQTNCICGESLDPANENGRRRRAEIGSLIEESRQSDAIQEVISGLFYGAQNLLSPLGERTWETEYSEAFKARELANRHSQEIGKELAGYEEEIKALPDIDVQSMRERRDHYRQQLQVANDERIRLETRLQVLHKEVEDTNDEHSRLLKQSEKGQQVSKELAVAEDLRSVLENALVAMRTREVKKVGRQMNSVFLEMIGSDPQEGSLIQEVFLTEDFQISVTGKNNAPLETRDLNGASRRALTLSFVLALAKVSEVNAPNVVDTPLGMMSGYVKQKVLERVSSLSSQLILFLTHSEILGCESILDRHVGKAYTFSNPAHFPKILINRPQSPSDGLMVCGCGHRDSCLICERRELPEGLEATRVQ